MKKIVSLAFASVLLLSMAVASKFPISVEARPGEIVVPDDYVRIQWAIGNATDGDTILARAGTYYEHVVLDKPVALIGENKHNTIIDGNGTGNVIKVTANNVKITGFTVQNSGSRAGGIYVYISSGNNISHNIITNNYYGIKLYSSRNNTLISNNVSSNDDIGIWLERSNNNTLAGNNVSSNDDRGIWLRDSSNNTLAGNNVSSNKDGIMLHGSSNNTFSGNNVSSNNQYNFGVYGDYDNLVHFINYVDAGNTVDDKPIYYLMGAANVVYDAQSNAGTIYLINCNNITIRDLTLTKNWNGIFFWNTTNSKIENLTASNNRYGIQLIYSSNNSLAGNNVSSNAYDGIWLRDSSNNSLTGNTVSNSDFGIQLLDVPGNNSLAGNTVSNNNLGIWLRDSSNNSLTGNTVSDNRLGIHLFDSSNNSLTGNTVSDNGEGIHLTYSGNNIIYHNNFINNANQVYNARSTNFWDYGGEGNYWSDYEDEDRDGDGMGDSSYVIDENNRDNHPLMSPWTPTWRPTSLWTRWWFWTMVAAGIAAVLAGAIYFLKKRKPPTPTAPKPLPKGTDTSIR